MPAADDAAANFYEHFVDECEAFEDPSSFAKAITEELTPTGDLVPEPGAQMDLELGD